MSWSSPPSARHQLDEPLRATLVAIPQLQQDLSNQEAVGRGSWTSPTSSGPGGLPPT